MKKNVIKRNIPGAAPIANNILKLYFSFLSANPNTLLMKIPNVIASYYIKYIYG